MRTKSQKTQTQAILSVSKALPSLMRSTKIQQKAAKVGFDWENVNGALDKLLKNVKSLKPLLKTMMLIISVKNSVMCFSQQLMLQDF